VDRARRACGRKLAREHPAQADCVVSVPDSANSAALGYAEESGIPFELGLLRNHYVGRTFIKPSQADRDFGARLSIVQICAVLGVNSLGYLSQEGMENAVAEHGPFCNACFSGNYSSPLIDVEKGLAPSNVAPGC
jgi:glutamine phosphoribosylpyrophosphate amidotransferase